MTCWRAEGFARRNRHGKVRGDKPARGGVAYMRRSRHGEVPYDEPAGGGVAYVRRSRYPAERMVVPRSGSSLG